MYSLDYQYKDASTDTEALNHLNENDFRSVPQIYVDGNHIGGFTEFKEFIDAKTE